MKATEIKERLLSDGAAEVGFSDVTGLLPERLASLPYGISIVFKLSDAVVDEILSVGSPGPTYSYFQHYRAANAFLDARSLWVTSMLEREGFRAFPVAASQSVPDAGAYSGLFQHKTAAVRSGLGFIGKSALFVSHTYGPRVRLATVLTDMPLPVSAGGNTKSGCGSCRRCVTACPAMAITGKNYEGGMARSELFDPKACSEHMKEAYKHIGRGAVCGICMAVCPYGETK